MQDASTEINQWKPDKETLAATLKLRDEQIDTMNQQIAQWMADLDVRTKNYVGRAPASGPYTFTVLSNTI